MARVRLAAVIAILGIAPLWAFQAAAPSPKPIVPASASTGAPQGRGRANQPAPPPLVAAGLIVGRVIDATSGKPVSGAVVTLNGGPQRIGSAPPPSAGSAPSLPPQPPRILTDTEGRYAFRNLTRGTYNITATKSGYSAGAYGRMRPEGPTRPVQLDDNERIGDVTIRLFKYASIAGLVVDEAGEPIVGAQVRADRRVWRAGRRTLQQTTSASTDDRGMYRLFNLIPGEYVVSVPVGSGSSPTTAMSTDEARKNLSGTSQALAYFAGGNGGGIQATADSRFLLQLFGIPNGAMADGAGRWRTYATTYYPGSLVASGAESVSIGSGDDRTGIDFNMRYVAASSVSGVVVGPNGPVPQYALRLVPSETGAWSPEPEIASATTDASGAFTFLAVPAGQYVIQTAKIPRNADMFYFNLPGGSDGASVTLRSSAPAPAVQPEPLLWAMTPVTVAETDVAGVALTLREGLTVSGRLEFAGSRPRPDGQRLAQVPIVIEPADGRDPIPQSGPPSQVRPDGRFVSAQRVPGKYFIRVGGAPPGFIVQSITANGADAMDAPIDLGSSVTNVVITFTDLIGSITGTVRGIPAGADPPAIVLFPADRRGWKDFGLNPSRLKLTRAGVQSGGFSFGSLAAGDYFVIAIGDEYSADWMNPDFIEQLSRTAQRITLAPGEKRIVDLPLSDIKPQDSNDAPARRSFSEGQNAGLARRSFSEGGNDANSGFDGLTTQSGPFVSDATIVRDRQSPPQTVRDGRPPEVAGTGSISGIVTIHDGSGKPARLARVSVSGNGLAGERIALTDDAGRFTIAWLPAGDYQVMAAKPGYLSMFYGARRPGPGAIGVPVHVEAGKPALGIDIAMLRGGVVSGLILDQFGAPAPGVRVQLQNFTRREGERVLVSVAAIGQTTTDDRGIYRLYGVRPGTYVITATPQASSNVEVRQLSESEIRAAIADAARGTPPPSGPRTIAPAAVTDVPAVQLTGRSVGFSPVYYPGTPREQEAVEFTVSAGQELTGINLQLVLVPAARLEGRVYGPNGQPASAAQVSLMRSGGSEKTSIAVRQQEGNFQVVGVPAGRYTLVATMEPPRVSQAAGATATPPAGPYYAQQEIDVTGVDQTNLTLSVAPMLSLSGRVLIDGAAPPDMRQVRVQLEPVGNANRSPGPASPDQSGAFTITGVLPGRYRLSASASASSPGVTWAALSSQIDGQDGLVTPFEIRADRPPASLVVTLTDRPAEISGTLLDGAGRPVAGMTLLVFPTDRSKWIANSSRVNRSTRSGPDGTYRFASTLPGEYYLVVVTDLDPVEWTDPAFKEQLVAAAQTLTIGKGEKKVLNMKMAR
ncbi:MAG TPA: carboxypeptidase-like regulatory domain-containing protein [Vicinamibacterales bacterium]|nr:carboxypeptidase-like regulatory domain-containing protein [Vicinamibacterales bacterium]